MMSRSEDEIERIERELDEVLRAYGVEPGGADLARGEAAEVAARAPRIVAAVLDAPLEPDESCERRRRPSRSWLLATAAAVGVLFAGGLLWPFDSGPEAQALTPPLLHIDGIELSDYPLDGSDPDRALERVAALAEANGVEEVPPDAIHMIESTGWWAEMTETPEGPGSHLLPIDQRVYREPDGTLRFLTRWGAPLTVEGEVIPGGRGPVETDETLLPEPRAHRHDPATLSRAADTLRGALLRDADGACAGIEGFCLLTELQGYVSFEVIDGALEAALIRTLIGADDLRYIGPAQDRIDREVEVFVLDLPDGTAQQLILFDARTGTYVGDETVMIRAENSFVFEPPAVIEFNVVLERGFVGRDEMPPPEESTVLFADP